MRFEVPRRQPPIIRYKPEDVELARTFLKKLYDEVGNFIRAAVLFGSAAREIKRAAGRLEVAQAKAAGAAPPGAAIGEARPEIGALPEAADIDLLVIVDDVSLELTPELVETYRILVEKLIAETSPRLHITTLKFTSFWEYVKAGDPVAINILRDGAALIDTGFFDPLQVLLLRGRIRPTAESMWSYFIRAPTTLHNSKWHVLQATIDLYWAVIDAAHAALIKVNEVPPSPAHVADLMQSALVAKGFIPRKYVATMKKFYELYKDIVRREIKEIKGRDYESYYKEAEDFVAAMRKVVEKV